MHPKYCRVYSKPDAGASGAGIRILGPVGSRTRLRDADAGELAAHQRVLHQPAADNRDAASIRARAPSASWRAMASAIGEVGVGRALR